MPTLPDSLRAFAARVRDDTRAETDPGYEVYRRNLHGNFATVLALEFPAVQRLLGDASFRGLARDFQCAHPSTCGDLHRIGAPFAAWLRAQPEVGALPWIADVAALEWAWEEAAVAADAAQQVNVAAFVAMGPDRQLALRARLHPALRVIRSAAPIHRIWRDNLPDAHGQVAALATDYTLSLDQGGETVLVERPGHAVEVSTLQPGEAAWLEALSEGETMGIAIDRAVAAGPAFELGTALAAALQRARIVAFR
ncbi:MAG: DNA-binding domain-containing protein [Steroidobacteraceae bacterium]